MGGLLWLALGTLLILSMLIYGYYRYYKMSVDRFAMFVGLIRYQILLGLCLLFVPVLLGLADSDTIRQEIGLQHGSPLQWIFVPLLVWLVALAIVSTATITLQLAHLRFGLPQPLVDRQNADRSGLHAFWVTSAMVLSVPLLALLALHSGGVEAFGTMFSIVALVSLVWASIAILLPRGEHAPRLSADLSVVSDWAPRRLRVRARRCGRRTSQRALGSFQRIAGAGYVATSAGGRHRVIPLHLWPLWIAIALLLVMTALLVWFEPSHVVNGCSTLPAPILPPPYCLPLLVYFLIPAWLIALLVAGLAFLFDRWHLDPILLMIVLGIFLFFQTSDDYRYLVQPADESMPEMDEVSAFAPLGSEELAHAWCAARPAAYRDLPAIVVASSGGGVRASAWTARVLAGLELELGECFTQSLLAVSSVSGASIGSLHYLAEFERNGRAELGTSRLVEAAGGPSLHAIAWAWLFQDLLHPLRALGARSGFRDRGNEVEALWRSRLPERFQHMSLYGWRELNRKGLAPAMLINATDADRGTAVSFAPISLPSPSGAQESSVVSFVDVAPAHDIELVTAARMSATFPFVTPISAAEARGLPPVYLADGGYVDNSGSLALASFLDALMPAMRAEEGCPDQVVLIRIRNAGPQAEAANVPERRSDRQKALYGPISTLIQVRSAQQKVRDRDLLRPASGELDRYGRPRTMDPVETLSIDLTERIPLSWNLSIDSSGRMERAWQELVVEKSSRLRALLETQSRGSGLPRACGG